MHHHCTTCAAPTAPKAQFCDSCGAPLAADSHKSLVATGPTTRLRVAARRPNHFSWRYAGVPLVGLAFASSVVLSFALTLATIGFSPASVALTSVPAIGAVLAQAAWMQQRLARGFLGMLACLGAFWLLIVLAPLLHL